VTATLSVIIQEADFDVAHLQSALLRGNAAEGAVATFTGYVRNVNNDSRVDSLELEHYPGMTERSIGEILHESAQRWPIYGASVVHRVGLLHPGDQIVWVGVSSAHRAAAFAACDFIMDYLKTRAPFWKKETGPQGSAWVEARDSDAQRARRWRQQQAQSQQ